MSGQPAALLAASVLPPLGALRTAPATARGHVRSTLAAWRLSELTDTVELVVSELAANAVNASIGPDGHLAHLDGRIPVIRVRLFAGEAILVAEVWDEAGGVPARKNAGTADESGRGLDLVHVLTDARWGLVSRSFRARKVRLGGVPHPQPFRRTANRRWANPASERHAERHGAGSYPAGLWPRATRP